MTRSIAAQMFAPALLLVTPLIVFLRYQNYSLWGPEAVLLIGSLFGVGCLLGLLVGRLGDLVRIPMLALLVMFFLDFQNMELGGGECGLAVIFFVTLGIGFVIRTNLSTILCVMVGTICLGAIVFPVGSSLGQDFHPEVLTAESEDLPPIVHIVLDEQIGVEGIPAEVDLAGRYADVLKRFYLDRGFDVYGKAYSISWHSRISISTALALERDRRRIKQIAGPAMAHERLAENAYFEEMSRRGYRIHVYQSDYMDFCHGLEGTRVPGVVECQTHILEGLAAVADSPTTTLEKAGLILGMYSRLSEGLVGLRVQYLGLRFRIARSGVRLPDWSAGIRLSPLSVMPVFEQLGDDLSELRAGHLYFAHLVLPHYPYAFDEDCDVRSDPFHWLTHTANERPGGNDPAARRERYALYLQQMTCTQTKIEALFERMKAAGRFEGTTLLVHGDHGSRIGLGTLGRPGPISNRIDRHSTLFAFRSGSRGNPPVYHDELLSINALLPLVFGLDTNRSPSDSAVPTVLENGRFRRMPDFAGGRVKGLR